MYLRSQAGGASIISVGFISIFVLILTVAITRLMVGELRHAIDLENNIKAYYLAESGIEESVLALRQFIANRPTSELLTTTNQNCDRTNAVAPNQDGVLDSFGAGGGTFTHNPNITCRRVRTASNFVQGSLLEGDSAHFDLSRKNFQRIEIEWDSFGLIPGSPDLSFLDSDKGGNAPPYLEVTRIHYNNTGPVTNVAPADIKLKSLYFAPIRTGVQDCGNPSVSLNFETCDGDDGTLVDGGKVKTRCGVSPVYRCKVVLTNFMEGSPAAKRTVLRLRRYFGAAQYTMKIYDSLNNRVDVVLDKTILDVTAKIGDSYRRIEQEINLVPRPADGIEAVFGDDKVCKKFDIIDTGLGEFVNDIPPYCKLD